MKKRVNILLIIAAIAGLIAIYFFTEVNYNTDLDDIENIVQKLEEPKEVKREYGFSLDSFQIEKLKIGKGQNLGDILWKHKIPHNKIFQLVTKAKPVFDVRKIRVGNEYTIFKQVNKEDTLQLLVYEKNAIEYIIFDLRDTMSVSKKEREIRVERKEASGIINSSLYMTLQNQGYNPELALKLADIYAWSIDFYRIQKGDKFKVVYEEKFVEEKSVGIKDILISVFNHAESDFFAFEFMQDSILEYYDEEGNSLRKAFLKAPLNFSRISSRFTYKRYHPVQKRWKAHLGTDYAAPRGTPIQATGAGVVSKALYQKYNGNNVKIRHNSTYSTQYLHMTNIAKGIRPGVRVKQGQVIGYVGSTGLATGPHVCYRFWKNGKQVDPYSQKIPASKPVKKENKELFEKVKIQQMDELNKIDYPSN